MTLLDSQPITGVCVHLIDISIDQCSRSADRCRKRANEWPC